MWRIVNGWKTMKSPPATWFAQKTALIRIYLYMGSWGYYFICINTLCCISILNIALDSDIPKSEWILCLPEMIILSILYVSHRQQGNNVETIVGFINMNYCRNMKDAFRIYSYYYMRVCFPSRPPCLPSSFCLPEYWSGSPLFGCYANLS